MDNNRRKIIEPKLLEISEPGNANGLHPRVYEKERSLYDIEKHQIIEEAAKYYAKFLEALGVDWENDPNSKESPQRIAKKYVNDLWKGRYELPPDITSFPSDGYKGMVLESNIPLISMCSHHHESIIGRVHIAYVPGEDARVIGLSKLNRIVEHFGRRGAIQEQLTMALHNAVDQVCEGNIGVAVSVVAEHQCVSCRGTKHQGASMVTNHISGVFRDRPEVRNEYFESIKMAYNNKHLYS